MRLLFLVTIAAFSSIVMNAQQLLLSPTGNMVESLEVTPGRDVESIIYLKNNSGKTALVKWVFESYSGSVAAYEFSMCDLENCYAASSIVREIQLNNGDSTFMKFGTSAKCQAGTSTATLRAWIDGDSANSVVPLSYNVTITQGEDCLASIGNELTTKVSAYPIPVNTVLNLRFENDAQRTVAIFDVTGRMVAEKSISEKTTIINTAFLEKGNYVMHIMENNKVIATKKLAK